MSQTSERATICIGSFIDLAGEGALMDAAIAAMRSWTHKVALHCTACARPLVAVVADGSKPHRKASLERPLRLNICDRCLEDERQSDNEKKELPQAAVNTEAVEEPLSHED